MKVHCSQRGGQPRHRADPGGQQGKGRAQARGNGQGEGRDVYSRGESGEEKIRRRDWRAAGRGGGGGSVHVGKRKSNVVTNIDGPRIEL